MRMIELILDKEQLAKVNPALQTLWQDEYTLFEQVPEKILSQHGSNWSIYGESTIRFGSDTGEFY